MQDRRRARLGLLLVGFATFIVMGAGQSLLGPALPAFARSFGIAPATAGQIVTALWVGCASGVAAAFARPVRATTRMALAGMAAGAAGVALSPVWTGTLAGAVVFGFGYGIGATVLNPRVLHAFGPRGPAMTSLLNAIFSLGAIGAPLVFVALGRDPVIAFLIVAALCLAIWLPARDEAPAGPDLTQAAPLRPHYGILGFQAVAVGIEASLIGLGPSALVRAGVTETHAAELLSLFFVAFLAVRLLMVVLIRVLAPFTVLTLALALATTACLGASLLSPGPFFVLAGFSAGAFFPSGYVTAAGKMGDGPRVTPVVIGAGLVGGILEPAALSAASALMGPRGFFRLVAGLAGLAAVAALIARPAMMRPAPPVSPPPARF